MVGLPKKRDIGFGFVSDAVVVLFGWRRWKMGVMFPYHYEPPNRFESKITKHHVLSPRLVLVL